MFKLNKNGKRPKGKDLVKIKWFVSFFVTTLGFEDPNISHHQNSVIS